MKQKSEMNEWFATWFNSPYYHLLYNNRSEHEANLFLDNLILELKPANNTTVLDLACGAGRHARALAKYGLSVSGCDLSPNSIEEAKRISSSDIHFFVHDMRNALPEKYIFVFNLFTSFGYFESQLENLKVLQSVHNALLPDGLLVLDFMNVEKVKANLKSEETIQRDSIAFSIRRKIENGIIIKDISFTDHEKAYSFQERVQALTEKDFEKLLTDAKFVITKKAGDYQLTPFDEKNSDRLILFCKKI